MKIEITLFLKDSQFKGDFWYSTVRGKECVTPSSMIKYFSTDFTEAMSSFDSNEVDRIILDIKYN